MSYFIQLDAEDDANRKKNKAKDFINEVSNKLTNMSPNDDDYEKLKSDLDKLKEIYNVEKEKAIEQIRKLK